MKQAVSTARVQQHRAAQAAAGRRPVQVTVAEADRPLVKALADILNQGGAPKVRLLRQMAIIRTEVHPKQKVELPR